MRYLNMLIILRIMILNALENHTLPERINCCPSCFFPASGPQNDTKTMVSGPVGQKKHISQMVFNDSYLASISLILHCCARIAIPMVSLTGRFGAFKNDKFPKCVFNKFIFFLHETFKNINLTNCFGAF